MSINIDGQPVGVDEFHYIGSNISNNVTCKRDLDNRIKESLIAYGYDLTLGFQQSRPRN